MWGTDNEWRKVALNFGIEDQNPRLKLVEYLSDNWADRQYIVLLMADHGILEQAMQIAKENDIDSSIFEL